MRLALFTILLFFALSFAQEQQSEADKRADLLGNIRVTEVRSLNEAKGSYKSPRKAMFMSLVLPGSGQLYVGGKQSRYIRGVFYLAEEATLIFGLYYHSIYKYDKQVEKYKNFAGEYFSITKYEKAMNDIYDPEYETPFRNLYGQQRDGYCKSFYGNSTVSETCLNNFGKTNGNPNDDTPLYNSSNYYNIIASESFVLGWEDVIPEDASRINSILEKKGDYIPLGSSNYRNEYLSMRKKANRLADSQALFFGALILNHIVSAVDAVLSARAHNNSLYENKVSFLDKIRLDSNFNVGENFKAEAGLAWAW